MNETPKYDSTDFLKPIPNSMSITDKRMIVGISMKPKPTTANRLCSIDLSSIMLTSLLITS